MTRLEKITEFFNQPKLWTVVGLLSLVYGYHQRYYYDSMGHFILALVVCVFACANINSSHAYQVKKRKLIEQQEEEINQFWDDAKADDTWHQETSKQEEAVKLFLSKFKTNSHWEKIEQIIINQIKHGLDGDRAEKETGAHNLLLNASTEELKMHLNKDDHLPDNLLLTVQAFYRLKMQNNIS